MAETAAVTNQPGRLTWEDLRSGDPDTARTFYGALFGYRFDAMDGAPDDYTTFAQADEEAPLGGMGPFMGPDDTPPHWLCYFGVADAAAAVDAAQANGGAVVTPAFPSPFGMMAGITDPDGALFWIVETEGQDLPDRGD